VALAACVAAPAKRFSVPGYLTAFAVSVQEIRCRSFI
jgi:hypothetical protein